MVVTTRKNKAFDALLVVLMAVFCAVVILPFLNVISVSLSPGTVALSRLYLVPPEVSFVNYERVLSYTYIRTGFVQTLFRVILGTSLSLVGCVLTAYPLSKRTLPLRALLTGLFVFTMFFRGGLIPSYLLVQHLGLTNTIWSLVLPMMIPTFAMLIMRNFFMTLPDSIEESAVIDGAGSGRILVRIVLPMSTPIVATVALWQIVWHWNSWFDSMIYIRDANRQVLQMVMRSIVIAGNTQDFGSLDDLGTDVSTPETLKAATIMITVIPIVCVYPFLQRYFVKGIIVGSLKG